METKYRHLVYEVKKKPGATKKILPAPRPDRRTPFSDRWDGPSVTSARVRQKLVRQGWRDLERLRLVLDYLPDEALMRHLEADRGQGRDDYPIRAAWNSLLAGVVFEHPSVETLRRELGRNASLRQACGFDPLKGLDAVPPPWAYTHFLKMLLAHPNEIDAIFDDLVERLRAELPGFGRVLACDGKALRTHARPRKKDAPASDADGRWW